jgi:hypothetical protein
LASVPHFTDFIVRKCRTFWKKLIYACIRGEIDEKDVCTRGHFADVAATYHAREYLSKEAAREGMVVS